MDFKKSFLFLLCVFCFFTSVLSADFIYSPPLSNGKISRTSTYVMSTSALYKANLYSLNLHGPGAGDWTSECYAVIEIPISAYSDT